MTETKTVCCGAFACTEELKLVRFGGTWMIADLFTRGRILWLMAQR